MTTRVHVLVLAFVLSATPSASSAANRGEAQADSLRSLDFLVGAWQGTSEGTPGTAAVEREYRRALNDRFIQVHNRSVYAPQPKNPNGEIHEDVGFISFDRMRRRFVLRQFHVEGFVNQYVAEPASGNVWTFTSESIENIPDGWRARETYTVHGPNEVEEVFELAAPGKAFEVYSRVRLVRKP